MVITVKTEPVLEIVMLWKSNVHYLDQMIKHVQFYTILLHQHQQYAESPQQVNSLTMWEIVKLVKIHQLFIIGIKDAQN